VHADPQRPGWVTIAPGYAISCCGDDILVCEPAPYDLRPHGGRGKDTCLDLADPPPEPAESVVIAGFQYRADEVRVLDLAIGYDEKLENPQTALNRSDCRGATNCEYSRAREWYKFMPQVAYHGSDTQAAAAARWRRDYDRCLDVVRAFQKKFPDFSRPYPDDIRAWLLKWLTGHPLGEFSFLRDQIADLEPLIELSQEAEVARVLFWMVQDCRNAFLSRGCHGCDEADGGVPLARVWLYVPANGQEDDCRVLHIDNYPPYRRPLGLDCWPAPPGMVNLGQIIWRRRDEACAILAELGVPNGGVTMVRLPSTVAGLLDLLECDLLAPYGDAVTLQLIDPGVPYDKWSEVATPLARVVGVCGAADKRPPNLQGYKTRVASETASGAARGPASPAPYTQDRPLTEAQEVPDDLTRVKGIKAKLQERLRQEGIVSYRQLAAMSPERLRQFIPNYGNDRINALKEEARKLAQGKG
jgi:predicted flap endonuclease-1-like 5' DNA nuclease